MGRKSLEAGIARRARGVASFLFFREGWFVFSLEDARCARYFDKAASGKGRVEMGDDRIG